MTICVFGHPYSSLGTGEQLASFSRSLDVCHVEHKLFDIYGSSACDKGIIRPWLKEKETKDPGYGDIRIFHINGDEIIPCMKHLEGKGFDFSAGSKNIIIPAWELPIFPEIWREGINRFDEVWALSHYMEKMFSGWTRGAVRYVGQSAERQNGILYPRKYFGIKNSSLVFLSFFDQSSYVERKNPTALLGFYKILRKAYPYSDFQLVVKAKNIDSNSSLEFEIIDENVLLINGNLNYHEMTSLLDSSDVFVSLHRAEGFGRGGAEAVLRQRRAIVTNYSGVEDYSADPAILPVGYDLVPVKEGEYPYHEGQVWAEPRMSDALQHASKLINEYEQGFTNSCFFDKEENAGEIVQRVASSFSVGVNVIENLNKTKGPVSDCTKRYAHLHDS